MIKNLKSEQGPKDSTAIEKKKKRKKGKKIGGSYT
jgi:hypothetical protein